MSFLVANKVICICQYQSNQTDQEIREQSWIEGVPPGYDLVPATWVHSTETSVRHSESSEMWPGEICRISLLMGVIASPAWLLAPAEGAARPQGTLLKSAHSLHSLEACDVDLHEAGSDPVEFNSIQFARHPNTHTHT